MNKNINISQETVRNNMIKTIKTIQININMTNTNSKKIMNNIKMKKKSDCMVRKINFK